VSASISWFCAKVRYVIFAKDEYGIEPTEGGEFEGPALVQLCCATQGASIAYTLEGGADPHWKLYCEPIALPPGTTSAASQK
jgi:N-sulfoglucosamine sulfohydrolase